MLTPSRILYLHGLGGSPRSSKGLMVADWFAQRGIPTEIPSLAIPSFAELSPHRIVRFVADELARLADEPVAMIGSSFGAYVGLQALSRLPEAKRGMISFVVLLAPLFDPWDTASTLLSPEVEQEWKREGSLPLLDLELEKETRVHYRFVEELRQLSAPDIPASIPALIVHGTRDETVSCAQSERFAQGRANIRLELVDDDHRLLADPGQMLGLIEDFMREV